MNRYAGSLTGTIALVLGLALAVACTPVPAPAVTPAPEKPAAATPAPKAATAAPKAKAATPEPAGPAAVTALYASTAADLNPYNRSTILGSVHTASVFDNLVSLKTGRPTPMLAEGWETIDETTWEVTLKEATFTNGDPVTADDVKFVFEYGKDPANSTPFVANVLSTIDSVEAVDERTVRFTTSGPDPILPNRLSNVPIFSVRAFEEMGAEAFLEDPVGVGPYVIAEFRPQESVRLVRNESYYGEAPLLDEIVMRAAPDTATRAAALRTGEADVIAAPSLDQVEELRSFAQVLSPPYAVMNVLFFDTNTPELASREVRLAINHAIDRESIVELRFLGLTKPAQGQPLTEGAFGFNPDVELYAYDEAQARQLMAEGGYPDGFAADIGFIGTPNSQGQLATEVISPYLEAIGIEVTQTPIEAARYASGFGANELGPLVMGTVFTTDVVDPAAALSSFVRSGRFPNPELERLQQEQATELDPERREAILREIMQLLHDEAAIAPLWDFWNLWGVSNRVENFDVPLTGHVNWAVVGVTQ